mmetsp:Transcript_16899/g.24780  ORF Transcript_16899/g.24780 Transcript_16899/m.24780 type:complete len:81 (-) Transcript_16899:820-1062(-)
MNILDETRWIRGERSALNFGFSLISKPCGNFTAFHPWERNVLIMKLVPSRFPLCAENGTPPVDSDVFTSDAVSVLVHNND